MDIEEKRKRKAEYNKRHREKLKTLAQKPPAKKVTQDKYFDKPTEEDDDPTEEEVDKYIESLIQQRSQQTSLKAVAGSSSATRLPDFSKLLVPLLLPLASGVVNLALKYIPLYIEQRKQQEQSPSTYTTGIQQQLQYLQSHS